MSFGDRRGHGKELSARMLHGAGTERWEDQVCIGALWQIPESERGKTNKHCYALANLINFRNYNL